MKSIEITEDQKTKLLEMCKYLFPEYKNIYFRVDSKLSVIYPYEHNIDNNILRMGSHDKKVDLSIHWFEFCMTHLINRLNIIKNENNDINFIYWKHLNITGKHPVDFLYQEFKKLNITK